MKKNSTKKPATETTQPPAEAACVSQPTPAVEPEQPQQEQKPDFYARLLKDRPSEAASIMATLNRRKDFALRQLSAHLKAGRTVSEALQHAMALAFPNHQQAAP